MVSNARAASSFLKTLANEHRLLILCHLAQGEKRVGELEGLLGVSQPHLSQHLARLRRDGLVRTRRSSREVFYTIGSLEALRTIGLLYEMFCANAARDLIAAKTPVGKKPAKDASVSRSLSRRRIGSPRSTAGA